MANIFLHLKQKKNSVNISVTAHELYFKMFYNKEATSNKQSRICMATNFMMYTTLTLPNGDNWWLGCVMVRASDLWSINRLQGRLPVTHCQVSTWMGDILWAGKPFRYVTSHPDQLRPLCLSAMRLSISLQVTGVKALHGRLECGMSAGGACPLVWGGRNSLYAK